MTRPAVLTIAGSDSGGGAGIQADLKAIASFGVHGASALTAITAQNSRAVTQVFDLPDDIIEAQIDAVMSDLRPAVVKLGMLGTRRIVELVARKLEQWNPDALVVDPVMVASSGAALLEEDAIEAVRTLLLPMATVVTPNWDEAGVLISAYPRGLQDLDRIIVSFQRLGVKALLLKGGHLEGDEVVDTLFDGTEVHSFTHPRLHDSDGPEAGGQGARGHGTGCTLASALAANLALGRPLVDAANTAIAFTYAALRERYAVGPSDNVYLATPRLP